jgi:protein MpaA
MPLAVLLAAGCSQRVPYDIDPVVMPPKVQLAAAPATQPCLRPQLAVMPPPLPPRTPQEAPAAPAVGEVALGKSVRGEPITLHTFGRGEGGTLIFGGIHGNEAASIRLAEQLVEYLKDKPDACGGPVAVITCANPDGQAAQRRQNAHGVDLNRNFPASNWAKSAATAAYYGGERAGCEPETAAIIRAVELTRPARIIAIHSIDRGRQCNNYDGPGEAIARIMNASNGYAVKASIGYPTPGSFGTWAGVDRQIATLTLELPHESGDEACWKANAQGLLKIVAMPRDDATGR